MTGKREFWCLPTWLETFCGNRMQRKWQEEYGHAYHPGNTLKEMYIRVSEIIIRIAEHAQRPQNAFDYQATIVDQNIVNAWSYPGGKLFISKALIDAIDCCDLSECQGVERDDVLAAVVAHEIAHVAIGHWRKKIELSLSLRMGQGLSLLALGVSICFMDRLAQSKNIVWCSFCALLFFTYRKYVEDQEERVCQRSRNMEHEADKYGIKLMHEAGYKMQASLIALKVLSQASHSHVKRLRFPLA